MPFSAGYWAYHADMEAAQGPEDASIWVAAPLVQVPCWHMHGADFSTFSLSATRQQKAIQLLFLIALYQPLTDPGISGHLCAVAAVWGSHAVVCPVG